jgi:hypothetical protein
MSALDQGAVIDRFFIETPSHGSFLARAGRVPVPVPADVSGGTPRRAGGGREGRLGDVKGTAAVGASRHGPGEGWAGGAGDAEGTAAANTEGIEGARGSALRTSVFGSPDEPKLAPE